MKSSKNGFLVAALFTLSGTDVWACNIGTNLPYEVSSLIESPLGASYCFPVELKLPQIYRGQTLKKAYIRLYLGNVDTDPPGFGVEDNKNSDFEAELGLNSTDSSDVFTVKFCLSPAVAAKTTLSLVYDTEYPDGYSGPRATCAPMIYTIENLATKLLQNQK